MEVVEIIPMILTGSLGNIWVVEITRKYLKLLQFYLLEHLFYNNYLYYIHTKNKKYNI